MSLAEDSTWKQCTLNNISVEGANIVGPVASDLKNLLEIHFTRDGSVSFGAKVIWQNGDAVGVEFIDRPKPEKWF